MFSLAAVINLDISVSVILLICTVILVYNLAVVMFSLAAVINLDISVSVILPIYCDARVSL
jgi:hypothetical protein